MSKIGEQVTVVALAIVGVAVLAVILSKNSNTTGVIGAAGSGFSQALAAALSPVTGGGLLAGTAPYTNSF
ncbi:MAG TPA: hypothetical protein VIY48_05685 [Candidatus Paceibacterota bacterium]